MLGKINVWRIAKLKVVKKTLVNGEIHAVSQKLAVRVLSKIWQF